MPVERYPPAPADGTFFLEDAEECLPGLSPLIAYGSNRSPQVLRRKLPGVPVAAFAAVLRGWEAVHSSHVSPRGVVPATIVPREGAELDVHVLFLPSFEALDAAEPDYDRVTLDGLDLRLDVLGLMPRAQAHVSRHDVLHVDGKPVPLGTLSQARLRASLTS